MSANLYRPNDDLVGIDMADMLGTPGKRTRSCKGLRTGPDVGPGEGPEVEGLAAVGVVRKLADLNGEERQYLMAVERGDIPTVQQCLNRAKATYTMNINCVDPLGRPALLIAIENDNIEMIDLLLRFDVEVADALLHAINEDNVEATQMLLAYEDRHRKEPSLLDIPSNKEKAAKITARWKKLTFKKDSSVDSVVEVKEKPSERPVIHSSSFTPDITPLVLAAHRDNYEILKILLDRGDRIYKPHDVRCSCNDCVRKSTEDSLNHSQSRINAYRALASPSLMALSSTDPILTAFDLSWELRLLSRLENELKVEYEALSKQCQTFAVDLLDQTRGSKELEILLNYNPESTTALTDQGDRMNLSRLKLAIKYKQKKFVAHASCQQLLASIWYEGLFGFRRRHAVFQAFLTVSVCLLFPVFVVVYMVAPKSAAGQFIRRPFIKFLCHSSSYITFLFLLILASQRIESIINLAAEEETQTKMTREVRGAPPTSIEWMILAYVAVPLLILGLLPALFDTGLVWAEVKQLWDQGLKSYINDMWNILDFITNSLYIATYTLKLVAYLRVEEEKRLGQYHLAWASRDKWDAYDPTLISEGLFAAANIFSSLKIIYIFTVNPHLGPLQISLGRMVIDIMKFLFIALLVCFSYSCGVNQLYWYYAEARTRNCTACMQIKDNPADCKCDRTLANLFEIIQTLYFAIYGLVEISHFELKEKHEFTQFVGKLMYGSYCGIMTIVLINMFIAMLSSSYQKISDDQDTEWKFARSRLWMSYFEEGGTVPAPFNIIPTPKTIWYILKWFKERLCRCSKSAKENKWQSIRRAMKKMRERDEAYQAVMHDLVKRYIMKRQRCANSDGVNEDDVNEIKQDISSFRYELLEILRSNGMLLPASSSSASGTLGEHGHGQTNTKQRRKIGRSPLSKLCSSMTDSTSTDHYESIDYAPSQSSTVCHSDSSQTSGRALRVLTKQNPVDIENFQRPLSAVDENGGCTEHNMQTCRADRSKPISGPSVVQNSRFRDVLMKNTSSLLSRNLSGDFNEDRVHPVNTTDRSVLCKSGSIYSECAFDGIESQAARDLMRIDEAEDGAISTDSQTWNHSALVTSNDYASEMRRTDVASDGRPSLSKKVSFHPMGEETRCGAADPWLPVLDLQSCEKLCCNDSAKSEKSLFSKLLCVQLKGIKK